MSTRIRPVCATHTQHRPLIACTKTIAINSRSRFHLFPCTRIYSNIQRCACVRVASRFFSSRLFCIIIIALFPSAFVCSGASGERTQMFSDSRLLLPNTAAAAAAAVVAEQWPIGHSVAQVFDVCVCVCVGTRKECRVQ